jgi:hypothetical protein
MFEVGKKTKLFRYGGCSITVRLDGPYLVVRFYCVVPQKAQSVTLSPINQ